MIVSQNPCNPSYYDLRRGAGGAIVLKKPSNRVLGSLAVVLIGGAGLLLGAAKCASQGPVESDPRSAPAARSTAAAASDDRFLDRLLPLAQQPPAQRGVALARLAEAGSPRARYLLAVDALATGQPQAALEWLDGLDYPALAPFVRLQAARARELAGDDASASREYFSLQQEFPQSAAAAIVACEQGRPEVPEHPCSWELARQQLQRDPDNFAALLRLARYQPRDPAANGWRDRLVRLHRNRLSPADWQAIADGYWQTWEYGKAAGAYGGAPRSVKTLYRAARSHHLSDSKNTARTLYLQVIRDFPTDDYSGWALRRVASLSAPAEALAYLERAIAEFPVHAPEALLDKAKQLERSGNPSGAAAARAQLLRDFPETDAARTYRWGRARVAWLGGNLRAALAWAEPLDTAKGQFWVAKWQQQLGQETAAREQFARVLRTYPESYYAWRAADHLGYNVGNFTNARNFAPPTVALSSRAALPAGSTAVSELYLLGQDRDAFGLWQYETANRRPQDFTVAEQFADGLLQLTQGSNLVGINRVWRLDDRQDPAARSQVLALQGEAAYWQALFPLPFEEPIRAWSRERQLDPLLVAALIRQESRFEPKIRSRSNATGLMQILPSTGQWIAGKLGQPRYSLENPEDNIKFGTWYLRYTHERYGNNSMLAVASYNGGPGNVAKWVQRYGLQDADRFVELIPFAETKGYVESVFGNYWNYLRLHSPDIVPTEAALFTERELSAAIETRSDRLPE